MRKVVGFCLGCVGVLLVCLSRVILKVVEKAIESGADKSVESKGVPWDPVITILTVAIIVVGLLVLGYVHGLGFRTLRYGKRWRAPYAAELLAKDRRKPILLLRAFDDDEKFDLVPGLQVLRTKASGTLEEVMVACLKRVAPVVAIGRPGEWAPPLGAGRLYVDNDWKAEVRKLVQNCRHIIVTVGATEGLAWELRELVRMHVLDKVIFVLPPVPFKEIQRRWETFARQCRSAENIQLPQKLKLSANAVLATVDTGGALVVHNSRGVRARHVFGCKSDHYTKPLNAILDQLTQSPRSDRGPIPWLLITILACLVCVMVGCAGIGLFLRK